MDKQKLKEQVETIRQAFGYINRFKNETFVIKIESSLISHPFFPILIKDIAILHQIGIRIVLVPGAKTRIDEVLSTYGIVCKTVDNIRISPPEAIPFIKMAAFDVSNKIMTMLAENNTNAVIGNWVRARGIGVRDGTDFQSSGLVEKLQKDIINNVLQEGLVPIFPNIGWNAQGKPYNLSSNELAFTISNELKAAKLFFITDFGGIVAKDFIVPKGVYVSSDGFVSQLTVDEAKKFIDANAKARNKGVIELASMAYRACRNGVSRVHIIDGRVEGMVLKEIFSNRGFGTMIYTNQFENIRSMAHADIPEVLQLMQPSIDEGVLVSRTEQELEDRLADYNVYEVDGTIHACGALHLCGANRQAEIAGVAVDEMYASLGIGRKLIEYLIAKAIKLKVRQVFVLTTQSADWFSQLGFTKAAIKDLPKERQASYNMKRNSLILTYKISAFKSKRPLAVE
jgi:amino-acid N-acetyltransferase